MKNLLFFFILNFLSIQLVYTQECKILRGHDEDINTVSFSKDCKYLFSGGDDETLIKWDIEKGTKIKSYKVKTNPFRSNVYEIFTLSNTNDNIWITTGSSGPNWIPKPLSLNVYGNVFNLTNGTNFKIHYFGVGPINISYSSTTNKIYSIMINNIYRSKKWQDNTYVDYFIKTVDSKSNTNDSLILFSDGDHINENDATMPKLSTETFCVSPSGKYYVFPNKKITEKRINYNLKLYNGKNNKLIREIKFPKLQYPVFPQILKFDPNENYLFFIPRSDAVKNDDEYVFIYNIQNDSWNGPIGGHKNQILCLDIHPSGFYFATGSKDNKIIIWDHLNGKILKTLSGHDDNIRAISFSPDGAFLSSGSDDETIRIWDISNLTEEIKEYKLKYNLNYGIAITVGEELEKELKEIENKFRSKDEFETTEAYNSRIAEANLEKQAIEEKYAKKLNELKSQKQEEIENLKSKIQDEKQKKIEESIKDTILHIERIGNYNADKETFPITIAFKTLDINIPLADAVEFKKVYTKALIRAKKKLNNNLTGWEYYDIVIVNPNNNAEYIFK